LRSQSAQEPSCVEPNTPAGMIASERDHDLGLSQLLLRRKEMKAVGIDGQAQAAAGSVVGDAGDLLHPFDQAVPVHLDPYARKRTRKPAQIRILDVEAPHRPSYRTRGKMNGPRGPGDGRLIAAEALQGLGKRVE